MKRRKLRSAQKKKGGCGTNLIDFISKMPDDVLVMILSCLPIKYAAVTSTLSTRWRFLWRNLIQLNFDGSEDLDKTGDDRRLCKDKFMNQLCAVINSYNHPKVQVFRMCFPLVGDCTEAIDYCIHFALEKKVETLELDLWDKTCSVDVEDWYIYYYVRIPPYDPMVEGMSSLKNISLKNVTLVERFLNEMLKNSPCLEILELYHSVLEPHNHVGGQEINLKYLTIVSCPGLESISLYGFDLLSFVYSGPEIELHLHDLPKLKEVDIGEVSVGLENNVFRKMSSCTLSLEVLILDICSPMKGLDVNAIPKLPNVKKLKLVMRAEEDDSLLEFTSIARACPSLETFSISLHWYAPTNKRKKVRRVATPHAHKHLKLLEIIGYYGRISDLELAVYVINNAVALKKIAIDPRCHSSDGNLTTEERLKRQEAARSSAKHQLTPILPPGVDLAIR